MKIILLIMIGLSLLQAEFLRDDTNGVVLDTQTKLMWQDDAIGATVAWEGALQRCEDLTLATHSDWRLPNINEFKTIIDRSKINPAIVDGFTNTSSNLYWSSTSFKDGVWYVRFGNGYVYYNLKKYRYYVRCVRDGQ